MPWKEGRAAGAAGPDGVRGGQASPRRSAGLDSEPRDTGQTDGERLASCGESAPAWANTTSVADENLKSPFTLPAVWELLLPKLCFLLKPVKPTPFTPAILDN